MVVIDMTELATQNISGRVAGRSVVWCGVNCDVILQHRHPFHTAVCVGWYVLS